MGGYSLGGYIMIVCFCAGLHTVHDTYSAYYRWVSDRSKQQEHKGFLNSVKDWRPQQEREPRSRPLEIQTS